MDALIAGRFAWSQREQYCVTPTALKGTLAGLKIPGANGGFAVTAAAGKLPRESALKSPEAEFTTSKDTASATPPKTSAPDAIQEAG